MALPLVTPEWRATMPNPMLPYATRRALWAAFRVDDSARDAVASHQFAIADILYHVGACPVGWDFRHPSARNCLADMLACDHEADCGRQWPDAEYLPIADCPQALIYAGQVLARYRRRWFCDLCESRRSECSCD